MNAIYKSQDSAYKSPFGAVREGSAVTFTLRVPADYGCTTPYLLLHRDGEQPSLFPLEKRATEDGRDVFTVSHTFDAAGLYFYYFDLYTGYRKLFRGRMGESYISTERGPEWQLTVYDRDFQTPECIKGGVIYQIFPDRFYEGVPNKPMPFGDRVYRPDKDGEPFFWPTEQQDGYLNMDYYGGDLEGICQKLPYLESLGVTFIYLNPIFEAHSNHRYNTADYTKIDPLLGTNNDFVRLCKEAKKHGIRIILDGVFSHTGSDSVYFNREGRYNVCGAYNSAQSPYRPWYDFSPNYPCGYRAWWGFETLPEVNESDPSYREFICGKGGVIDTWLERGASGFRLDVADELPDDFIEEIRRAVKRHGDDKYLLGEVWEDATTKWSYGRRRTYLLGKGLDAVMNYPFKEAVLAFVKGMDAAEAADRIMSVCENYPAPALHTLMNFVSTHDTVRAVTAIAGESVEGKDRYWQSGRRLSPEALAAGRRFLAMAYALIYMLPGVPSIYYGDEICMQGYKDPFNRAYFDWNYTGPDLRTVLRRLASQRRGCRAMKEGALRILRAEGGILHIERRSGKSVAEACFNRTNSPLYTTLLGKHVEIAPNGFAVQTTAR